MRTTFGRSVLRSSAFALTCLALGGASARASALQTYSTSAAVGTDGISTNDGATLPAAPISFNPITSGSFTGNSSLGLGEFVVSTLPAGETVTYNSTPFTITYTPVSIAGVPYPTNLAPTTVTGTLSGMLSGNQSSVVATFSPIASPIFTSADGQYSSTLSVLNSPLALTPASAGGRTTTQAGINLMTSTQPPAGGGIENPTPTPEPTTFAILGTAMVGLGLRHRLRSARQSA